MKKITVIGAGTMGSGIAQLFATYDHQVNVLDTEQVILQKSKETILTSLQRLVKRNTLSSGQLTQCIENLTFETDFEKGVQEADLVLEAVTEREDVKIEVLRKAGRLCRSGTLLASNTSSISITRLALATGRPEQMIGMHFMNPVPQSHLVEIIKGLHTSTETTESILTLCRKIGKTPVEVKDSPGFVANRVLMPMINEAIFTLSEGLAGVEEIDKIMILGMGHPMGPLQLADYIGLDVCLQILEVLYSGFKNPKYAACPLLEKMVSGGLYGIKSGVGFYTYDRQTREKKVTPNI